MSGFQETAGKFRGLVRPPPPGRLENAQLLSRS